MSSKEKKKLKLSKDSSASTSGTSSDSSKKRSTKLTATSNPRVDKIYPKVSAESIRTITEINSNANHTEEILSILCDDVTSRLKEALNVSSTLLICKKRSKLTSDIFNQALGIHRVPLLYGHSDATNENTFIYSPEAKVHILDDAPLDLNVQLNKEEKYEEMGPMYLTVEWMKFEDTDPDVVKPELQKYFDVLKIALSHENENGFMMFEKDMYKNIHLCPILSSLLAVICGFLMGKLNGGMVPLKRTLRMLHALLRNRALPSIRQQKVGVTLLVKALLFCTLYLLPSADISEEEKMLVQEKAVNSLSFLSELAWHVFYVHLIVNNNWVETGQN